MQLTITPNFAQERALNMLRRDWKSHNTFMVYAPTGSGKTGLAAFIVAGFVSRGMRVLFCAPYTILIGQTANRFVEYGLPGDDIGYIWADHPNYDPDRKIQIASADTLIRRVFPDNIDLLIIDEAHLRKKRILQDIERLRASGVKVIGLSGTPFSPFLGKYYDRLIKPTTIGELIQRGDLSKYEFYAPTKPDLKGVKTKSSLEYGSDYNETQLAEIMCGSTLVGDIVQNWLENGRDLPTIAFCVNVAHANFLTIQFNQAGVNAEVMTADTPVDERQAIIHRFETGATKIIVSVGVLVAGFDSDVRCIIYARPTKSEIRWLQALGRGLRIVPGKESCLIFDHSGTVHRLGYPDSIEYDDLPGNHPLQNMITRAVITAIDTVRKCQTAGLKLIAGEKKENVEHLEPYGFTSAAQNGAEAVVLFPAGDRSHGVAVVVADRRFRLKGLARGEVALYDDQGQSVTLTRAGIVVNGGGKPVIFTNATKARFEMPIESTGDIRDNCDSSGKTMAEMRTTYNGHTHKENGDGGGITDKPGQSMS
ncbi:phage baseplate assembly protein V [Salmonella enterica]|nr:phage baseplate assembly protein V [Salmonella enterica]